MEKKVGRFSAGVSNSYPCWCEITSGTSCFIRFSHHDLADLEHLVREMKKAAIAMLPESSKGEV